MADDENENMSIVSRVQKNDRVRKEVSVFMGKSFSAYSSCNLHPEKSIENMKRYQSIKKHDRTVSVPDDENESMIIVSQIQKNDRVRKMRWRMLFGNSSCTYKLRRASRS